MEIPLSSPEISEEDIQAVHEVLKTPYISLGPKLEAFEEQLAAFAGCSYGVGVNSGTSGLHLAVKAAGIQAGDLVITTPFSYIASANCILMERAIPIFVDIDPQTFNIDPEQLANAADDLVQGGKAAEKWLPRKGVTAEDDKGRLKALLPVDIFGQPADYDQIQKTADDFDLFIIEDSCEALGAEYKGKPAGSLGDVGIFAFYPNKQLTTGEGGMLVTNRVEWSDLFWSLRNQGRDRSDEPLNYSRLGYNYCMDEMSAALGLSQLSRIEELLEKRASVAKWYTQRLINVPGIQTPSVSSTTTRMSWFIYVVRIDGTIDRIQVIESLRKQGIMSRPYFAPIHLQSFYKDKFGYQRGDFPESETAGDQCLALPFSSVMTEDQVNYVCRSLEKIMITD